VRHLLYFAPTTRYFHQAVPVLYGDFRGSKNLFRFEVINQFHSVQFRLVLKKVQMPSEAQLPAADRQPRRTLGRPAGWPCSRSEIRCVHGRAKVDVGHALWYGQSKSLSFDEEGFYRESVPAFGPLSQAERQINHPIHESDFIFSE